MELCNDIIKMLDFFGYAGEIYNAMDSGDSVVMVRAADRAISKLNIIKDICILNKKSLKISREHRDFGNKLFSSEKYKEALVAYNMAIAFALPDTLDMLFAVSNRSALLFSMRSLSCVTDIKKCLTMSCPPDLARRLNKRMLKAQAFIYEELVRDMAYTDEFVLTFFTKEFVHNEDVNSASSDVAFITNNGVRQITAKSKISPGKIVAIEPAFVTSNCNGYGFVSCYYCNKLLLNPSPCPNCCYAMFCTEECQKLCNSDYHSIECQIVDSLEKIYSDPKNMLAIRAAIKLSLKLGWDGFIAASENIGSSRMKVASTRETYSIEEPLSMLCYDNNQELLEGRMFNGSVICAIVLKHLDKVANYFPKDTTKRAAAKKAMSKIMFHLHVHFTNTLYFTSPAYEYKSDYDKLAQTSMGWFSMGSKLKHSCQPNLLVVGFNNRIALLSLRTIEKGEELTISFIDHFVSYGLNRSNINFRATHLFLRTKKMCSCNVCIEEWSSYDLKYERMTDRHADLYRRFRSLDFCGDKDSFQLVCEVLDKFPVKSKQYYEAYSKLIRFLNICQCKLSGNRCYSEEEVGICW